MYSQPSPTPESLFEEYEDDGEAQKISNSAETSTRSRSRSPNARSPYIDTSKTLVSPIPERRKAVAKSKAQDHERDLKDVTESTESLPASPQVESRTRDSGRGASPGKKTAVRKIKVAKRGKSFRGKAEEKVSSRPPQTRCCDCLDGTCMTCRQGT